MTAEISCRLFDLPAIIIVESNDIVLAEIVAVLYLNKHQSWSRVLCIRWAVPADVYRRTRLDRKLFTVEDYNSLASDDKPMFRPARVADS